MSNASRCRAMAARYARRAESAADAESRRALLELERLWLETAAWAERFDRRGDAAARDRIYALIDAAGEYRRKVA